MVANNDSVSRSIEVPAPPERVWEVLTDGDLLGVCLGGIATIDAQPGGEVTFVDDSFARVGSIDQFIEDARLSFIWYTDERDPTEVVIDLEPSEGGTTVRVTEQKFTWGIPQCGCQRPCRGSHVRTRTRAGRYPLMTQADAVFTALADPTRRTVFQHIAADGPSTATELAHTLPVTRQAVVKHLASLDTAGLVRSSTSRP